MNTKKLIHALAITLCCSALFACAPDSDQNATEATRSAPAETVTAAADRDNMQAQPVLLDHARERLNIYATFPLTTSLDHLSANQKKMIPILIAAAEIMDELFWLQAFGDKQQFLGSLKDPATRNFADINYGPWDRLDADRPFLGGYGAKPIGARFYPADMSKEEYLASPLASQSGLYSLVERDSEGMLKLTPYHVAYAPQLRNAADLLISASELADDPEFANYLRLRAAALTTDDYQPSDMAWMDMKNNRIDVVIGAIETYEDQLFNYRTSYEAYVLIKDLAWSERLSRYTSFLPELQRGLPVPDKYKQESPGSDSDLNAYDVIYYAGHSNAGSKTIAINLPNDEEVQLAKGTRRLQLKNAMRAKFDKILVLIADELIIPEQRKHITFDAFFGNTMFHEVAHGLGIKNTLDGAGKVRIALQELASPTEEGKADILGLYMVTRLFEKGEIPEGELMDNYVTFLAGIFRSIRFGATSAHGKANMVRFNFFNEMGAFSRSDSGLYAVDFEKMQEAMEALSRKLLILQGDGDYPGTRTLIETMGEVSPSLQGDLERLSAAGIPVDIVFDQGAHNLNL